MFSCFFDGQTLPSAVKNNTLGGFPGNPLFFFSGLFLAGPGAPGVAGPGAWEAMDLDSIEFL